MEKEITNATVNKKKVYDLKLNPIPKDFRTIGEVSIIKTSELAKMINDMFSRVFSDYHGSIIEVRYDAARNYFLNPQLQFRVLDKNAYDFSENESGYPNHFYAFTRMDVNTKSNLLGRVQRFANNAAHNGPKVEMTKHFKDVMKDYVITGPNGSFDWDSCFTTIVYGGNTYVRTAKIDILKLLKAVYGAKDPVTGSELFYQPSLNKPVISMPQYNMMNPAMAGSYDDWWISIMRLNEKNEQYVAEQQGIVFQNSGVPGNVITDCK